jgi:hypothetical protein
MDETRLRAVVREEIALAMKTLGTAAEGADGYETGELESSALRAIATATGRFLGEYKDACEWTDGERKRLTNPFTGEAPDVAFCDHWYPRNPDGTWSHICKNCGAREPHKHEYAWSREAGEMRCVHCGQPDPGE